MAQIPSLENADEGTKLFILEYCAPSPNARMNQIACVNRHWNIAWRRTHREIVIGLVEQVVHWLYSDSHITNGIDTEEIYPLLVDMMDLL